jgi:hypothetical protein
MQKMSHRVAMLRWLKTIRFALVDRLDLTNADERFGQRTFRHETKTGNQTPQPSITSNDQGDTP